MIQATTTLTRAAPKKDTTFHTNSDELIAIDQTDQNHRMKNYLLRLFYIFSIFFAELTGVLSVVVCAIQNIFSSFRHYTLRSQNILSLILCMFLLGHLAHWVFSRGSPFNPELKVFLVILCLSLLGHTRRARYISRFRTLVFYSMMTFTIVGVPLALASNGAIFRFPDYLPTKFGLISIYFGALAVLGLGIEKTKLRLAAYFLFVLLSGSGTALLGAGVILSFRLQGKSLRQKSWIVLGCMVLILAIIVGQSDRQRNLTLIDSIDRYAIQAGYVNWLKTTASPERVIFGCGIDCYMADMPYYIENQIFSDYLIAEGGAFVSGRNLHSDHLRIFNHFGLVGWAAAFYYLYFHLRRRRDLFWAITAMCLFNSIITTTPFFIALMNLIGDKRQRVPFHTTHSLLGSRPTPNSSPASA